MDYRTIIYAKSDKVMTITLNRPERHNAVNETMGEELIDCFNLCEDDEEVRAIILTGIGKTFCSGGDIEANEFFSGSPKLRVKKLLNAALPAFLEIRRIGKPVIAAVNGAAIGGGLALALACDLVIAAQSALFNSQYVLNGMSPDAGLSYILPRIVGDKRAAWLMFTGERITAQKACEMGLVNQVVEDGNLMDAATILAKRLAVSATLAIARIKELINRSRHESLENQMEYEKQLVADLALTEDVREAIMAFQEKRKPEFKGR